MDLKDFDVNNIDFNNVGSWPLVVKAIAIVIICLLLLAAGYWLITKDQLEVLSDQQREEVELKQNFQTVQKKANALEELRKRLDNIRETFGKLLQKLPNKTQVESLLVDSSRAGLASGLDFEGFDPGDRENPGKDNLFMELPIEFNVIGPYHELAKFSESLATLNLIVTQHDVSLSRQNNTAVDKLRMNATVKAYRYNQDGT